ncbi:MAG: hypothetical protein NTV87_13255, partial [Ignavibacteriae bacterium]|nr:hypothetical protein [Ignavibacteriota bacterium]
MKKIIVTIALFIAGIFLFMGQNYQDDMRAGNPKPQMRRLSPLPGYPKLPDYTGTDNYVNPNTKMRYVQSPEGVMSVSPNFRPHPTNAPGYQAETIIYASLLNPDLIFASANTIWATGSVKAGAYISTNGGFNWYGSDTVSPLSWCDPGPVIDKNNTYIISYIAFSGQIGVSYSTNLGLSWAPSVLLPGSTTSSDKNLSGT